MTNLLTLNYWFNPNLGPWLDSGLRIVYGFFGILIVLGLLAWYFSGKNRKNTIMARFWQKIQALTLTIGIIGLFLIFCRQQRIYLLAMPFWLLLLLAGGAIWGRSILKYYTKVIPQRKREQVERQRKEKYLA